MSALRYGDGQAESPAGDGAARQGLVSALDWLPIASLILAEDGTALAANQAWAALSAAPPAAAVGYGWLSIVAPADRDELRASLRAAAYCGEAGSADCRLSAGASRHLWSRWWWRSGPAGQVIACVAEMDDRMRPGPVQPDPVQPDPPAGPASLAEALSPVVHRLFGIGLLLQSEAGRADGPVAERLQRAVGELDELIRDVRSTAFRSRRPPPRR